MAQTLPADTRAQFVPFLATLDAVKDYLTISAYVMQIGGGLYFPLTVYREIQYTEAGDVLEESGYDVANLRGANHDLGKLYIALETALRI